MSKILIKNATILTMVDEKLIQGDILIEGQKIAQIGQISAEQLADPTIEIIDGYKTVAMPGLVNTHTHAGMTLLRSFADDLELMPWLQESIWPAEAKMTDEHIYWGTQLAIMEMIKSGTTTFCDMYSSMDQVAQAVAETGIRANLSRGSLEVTDHDDNSLRENKDLYQKWHGSCDGRLAVWFAPHAPFTCPPQYFSRIIDMAADLNTGLHVHVAETLDEIQQIKSLYGKTPVTYLQDLGAFERPTLAAHCVHLTEEDRAILVKNRVGIAHNPVSNMKLASGIAPIPQLLAEGAIVGLGTDGASSNNSLNMFRDLSLCAFLHKVNSGQPTVMTAFETLRLATVGGANALHWGDEIGTLEVGKKADIILVDIDKPHYCPWNNVVSDLVYSSQGADVKTSIVNGKILMNNYQVVGVDVEKIMREAQRCAQIVTK